MSEHNYLDVALSYTLAQDFWALPEETIQETFDFLNQKGEDGFSQWHDEHAGLVKRYMAGGKTRQRVVEQHPESHGLLAYAQWRLLRDGALVNTMLLRYGYAKACCRKGAYKPCAKFLHELLAERSRLPILPPTPWEAAQRYPTR